jgi:CBS domain containing-hemolysin-like protein
MHRSRPITRATLTALALTLGLPSQAQASMFEGETLDSLANGIAWVAIIIGPIIGIAIFWLVHILPEKIAEKKKHPQTKAIQCLCLLSLVFGGLLWPLAWFWAYTKPVLHKLAYGTDVDESIGHHGATKPATDVDESHGAAKPTTAKPAKPAADEVAVLKTRVAELEAKLKQKGGKA